MTKEFDIEIDRNGGLELKIEGTYGDLMAEKLMREVNTIMFRKDCYCFGYNLRTGLATLALTAKGVLYYEK